MAVDGSRAQRLNKGKVRPFPRPERLRRVAPLLQMACVMEATVKKTLILTAMTVLLMTACSGDDADDNEVDAGAANGGAESLEDGPSGDGAVISPPPPGQATVSVDGLELTLTEPGGLDCSISEDSFSYSFRVGDNEVTLGAGANQSDQGWLGAIEVVVANPEDGAGPVSYFPDLVANDAGIAVDGESMSYAGPMQKQPPQDGSNPAPVDAGDGTISVTCP